MLSFGVAGDTAIAGATGATGTAASTTAGTAGGGIATGVGAEGGAGGFLKILFVFWMMITGSTAGGAGVVDAVNRSTKSFTWDR